HPLSNIKNDPAFNHDSAGFNPVELVNTFLNPPLFLEVKKAPTPTNDVVFGIGKDSLRLNLGLTAQLVPEDQFGIGGSSRPLDPGLSIKGVRVGVMGWVHDDVSFGHGVGGDLGIAVVTGPIELGVGVNDIGATITWPDTRRDSAFYRDSSYSRPLLPNHIETKTKLPVSYLVNLAYTVGKTTLGADVLN